MKWAYEGIVLPMLTYGSIVWGHRVKQHLKSFGRLNRMAINTVVSVPRSTPTKAIELILGLKPLELQLEERTILSYIRLGEGKQTDWDGINKKRKNRLGHLKYWERACESYLLNETYDHSDERVERKFNVNLESLNGAKKYQTLSNVNVYTDGSKIEGHTGAGFQIYKGKEEIGHDSFKLPDWCTVFQAEILAIKESCDRIYAEQWHHNYIKLFCDSQAAILAINDPTNRQKTVLEARKSLNAVAEKAKYLTMVWTKAHVGTIGNERADRLAK
jgi:ribonuclease HI